MEFGDYFKSRLCSFQYLFVLSTSIEIKISHRLSKIKSFYSFFWGMGRFKACMKFAINVLKFVLFMPKLRLLICLIWNIYFTHLQIEVTVCQFSFCFTLFLKFSLHLHLLPSLLLANNTTIGFYVILRQGFK